ncbi:hypothetical protein ACH5RR_014658 [Cinchona calisaya]|uniref:PH domain-containing protein n=1 Tax=Cinchona calisaya TaxID=153742 RepID=A0ABD2ZRR8_9GENT
MGNCLNTQTGPSRKKIAVLTADEEQEEIKAWVATVDKINCCCPCQGYNLVRDFQQHLGKSRRVFYLINKQVERGGLATSQAMAQDESFLGRRIKIVVNKKQLLLLIRSAKELHSIRSLEKIEGYQKWRPSLATIPEL